MGPYVLSWMSSYITTDCESSKAIDTVDFHYAGLKQGQIVPVAGPGKRHAT